MNRMYRRRKFQLITISIDEPDQKKDVLDVLKKEHVSSLNYLSAIEDRDRLADLLDKEWTGPVPYMLLIAPGGKVVYRHEGPIEPLELRRKIVDMLGRTYAARPLVP
jgi:hypothetical protein